MLLLRHIYRRLHQLYSPPPIKHIAKKCLYGEEHHIVNPRAKIIIRSDIFMKIRATDMIDFPACNVLNGLLYGTNCNSPTAEMCIIVDEDEQKVEVCCRKLAKKSDFHCELQVPFQSILNIASSNSIAIYNLQSEEIKVNARKNIHVHNIRGKIVELLSITGNIDCSMFMVYTTLIETGGNGHIYLKKAQGTRLECKTSEGNIKIGSSYVLSTKFNTNNGKVDLRNVHKKTEVFIHGRGDLIMSSFNGVLTVNSNGGSISLYFIQVKQENVITADKASKATLYISEPIAKNVFMKVTGCKVNLDDTLAYLCRCLNKEKNAFQLSTEKEKENKLLITTKNAHVILGTITWLESMMLAISLENK